MLDKYLFHNEMKQFLLFNGQNDFVIKWQKNLKDLMNSKESFRGNSERK